MIEASSHASTLIRSLLRPQAYPHPVTSVDVIETHISWILLTGSVVYKLKKPVSMGFVEASRLDQRLHYCREELRLNQRLAPHLYCDVVAIVGPEAQASVGPSCLDPAQPLPASLIDVAVRMRQFAPDDLLSNALEAGAVDRLQLTDLATSLGHFHREADGIAPDQDYGSPQSVTEPVFTNLMVLDQLVSDPHQRDVLERHRAWVDQEMQRLDGRFAERHRAGAIRECHGDLHCANIRVGTGGRLEVFDAIDFNARLRWIDPISEMAFLVMDLVMRGEPSGALQLLNAWLECTGLYDALDLWPWYVAYRAMVRAKVSAMQLSESRDPHRQRLLQSDLQRYLQMASDQEQSPSGGLVLMHGLSGSGKSTLSDVLIAPLMAVRIRSDRERQRAFMPSSDRQARFSGDRYGPEVTEWLFHDQLPRLVQQSLQSGLSVIVDATFLRRRERKRMADLAEDLGRNWAIVHCRCSEATARCRIQARQQQGTDPSEADMAVRDQQMQWSEALDAGEQKRTVLCDEYTPFKAVQSELLALLQPSPGMASMKGC